MSGITSRVLPEEPAASVAAYRAAGGGHGVEQARRLGPGGTITVVEAAGLRGRGGAGFPTGTKWRTVAEHATNSIPSTVVVNGAEGEPGTFKDRAILRTNPFGVVEGAAIAALAVGADRVVIAVKRSASAERDVLAVSIDEARQQTDWLSGLDVTIVEGPTEYLFGEETALLEVLDGRPPFPRIAPPFRHGVDEVGTRPDEPAGSVFAQVGPRGAPPALVNNVETIANVPLILARGADWFRSVGTPDSPGTIVCTITGDTRYGGVAEVEMGTTLAEAIALIGGGPRPGRQLVAAISGVANAVVTADRFDTPLTYEDMSAVGSGLGAAGFLVFDDRTDLLAVAAGVARFLAVESCGQCLPCKRDGLAVADALVRIGREGPSDADPGELADRLATITDGARCYLAHQHQQLVGSLLTRAASPPGGFEAAAIVPIRSIGKDRTVELELEHLDKQPDWSTDPSASARSPVDRFAGDESP